MPDLIFRGTVREIAAFFKAAQAPGRGHPTRCDVVVVGCEDQPALSVIRVETARDAAAVGEALESAFGGEFDNWIVEVRREEHWSMGIVWSIRFEGGTVEYHDRHGGYIPLFDGGVHDDGPEISAMALTTRDTPPPAGEYAGYVELPRKFRVLTLRYYRGVGAIDGWALAYPDGSLAIHPTASAAEFRGKLAEHAHYWR